MRYCDLIDGQQRIATFVILVSCLASLYETLSREAASDPENKKLAADRARRLKEQYISYETEENRRSVVLDRLTLSEADGQYFRDKVHGLAPQAAQQARERDSHRRLDMAFDKIAGRLSSNISSIASLAGKLDALSRYEQILSDDCTVIHITTDDQSEAIRLFQVLNDRGTHLSEGDLLRAATLELMSPAKLSGPHRAASTSWDKILVDRPEQTVNFLKCYYSSNTGERPGHSSLFDDFMEAFFPQRHRTSLGSSEASDVVRTIQDIESEFELCRLLFQGDWPFARRSESPNGTETGSGSSSRSSDTPTACLCSLRRAGLIRRSSRTLSTFSSDFFSATRLSATSTSLLSRRYISSRPRRSAPIQPSTESGRSGTSCGCCRTNQHLMRCSGAGHAVTLRPPWQQ